MNSRRDKKRYRPVKKKKNRVAGWLALVVLCMAACGIVYLRGTVEQPAEKGFIPAGEKKGVVYSVMTATAEEPELLDAGEAVIIASTADNGSMPATRATENKAPESVEETANQASSASAPDHTPSPAPAEAAAAPQTTAEPQPTEGDTGNGYQYYVSSGNNELPIF